MTELKHEIKEEGISDKVLQYIPSVHLEVSKEQLEILEIGNTVTIKLMGKVKSLRANDDEGNQYEISLELQEVSIDPKENVFSKLAGDKDE